MLMKTKIFTLAAALTLTACTLYARYAGTSELNLRMWNNAVFTVHVNNMAYNTPSAGFSLPGLAPGNHHLKVFRHFNNPNGFGGHAKMVFNGFVTLHPNTRLFAYVGRNGQLFVESTQAMFPVGNGNACGNGNGTNWNGYGSNWNGYGSNWNNYGNNWNGFYGNGGNYGSAYYGNGQHGGNMYAMGMAPQQFEQLKYTINNTSFDNTRLSIMKQAVSTQGVSSAQVCELMQLLSFESNRLNFAKFAYAQTIDRENYFLVYNAFSFDSSIADLNNFISRNNG